MAEIKDKVVTVESMKLVYDEINENLNTRCTELDTAKVPVERKVNGKALSADIELGAEDVGATLAQQGVTASAEEINHLDGVTENVQVQLDDLAAENVALREENAKLKEMLYSGDIVVALGTDDGFALATSDGVPLAAWWSFACKC